MRANLSDAEVAERRGIILALGESLELIEVDPIVLERAAQPMPTEMGTLDAIHLATALLWKDMTRADLVMATHDGASRSAPGRMACAWWAARSHEGTEHLNFGPGRRNRDS